MATSAPAPAPQNQQQHHQEQHLFSCGVITDVQAADIDDGASFHGVPRYYRSAFDALERAVADFAARGVDRCLHLGDAVDMNAGPDGAAPTMRRLAAIFAALGRPTHHTPSNHDLYHLPRPVVHELLGIPTADDGAGYYSVEAHPAWRLVFVDAYDVSVIGWPEGHPRRLEAERLLAERNPNENKNSSDGLEGVARRFVRFGGGVSRAQLAWFERELAAAAAAGQNVIVGTHLPLLPGTAPSPCLNWHYDELLALMWRSGSTVVATLAGHAHAGAYALDDHGVHHLVLPSVLETPPGRDAYAVARVLLDRVAIDGVDAVASLELRLAPAAVARHARFFAGAAGAAAAADEAAAAAAAAAEDGGGGGDNNDAVVDVADADEGSSSSKAAAGGAADAVAVQLQACAVRE